MVRSVGDIGPVSITGGVAKNQGVVALLAESLGVSPAVAPEPQVVGALKAGLIAREQAG
jgi:activator of 2-hydroxyglutaryl-CoA dehydratase